MMPNYKADTHSTIPKTSRNNSKMHKAPDYDTYQTSLTGRHCSPEISQLFSQHSRHSTWRKYWLYFAESERELGI